MNITFYSGMSGVTLIYILLGFLGYAKYGDAVQGLIYCIM